VIEPLSARQAAVVALARVARMLERTLAQQDPPALSLSDYRMLSAVAGGEARASRLSARLAVGRPAVSASVDSLARRGLLTRHGGEGDQRAIELRITPEGDRVRAAAEEALGALVRDIAGRTPDAQATLAALAAFGEGIEQYQQEASTR
jgi:DNA-binding MarR family transcriptional regulator